MQRTGTLLSIAAVERETGLSKDVLRKWERRYGFPSPVRSTNGERAYPAEQLERLRLIKRLLDTGLRPGQVVGEPVERLAGMLGRARPEAEVGEFAAGFLDRLRRHDTQALRQELRRMLLRDGVTRFVQDKAPVLISAVGDAWTRGEIAIHEEHLFSTVIGGILSGVITELIDPQGRPRILLTTLPGEAHGLGVMLAAALMSLEGAYCLNLGTETPPSAIGDAVLARRIDLVALSFSVRYPARQIAPALAELRDLLPRETAIWVGGAGLARAGELARGIRPFTGLDDVSEAIAAWRGEHPANFS